MYQGAHTCTRSVHMYQGTHTCTKERTHVKRTNVPRSAYMYQECTHVPRSDACTKERTYVPGVHTCTRSAHIYKRTHTCTKECTHIPGVHTCTKERTHVPRSAHIYQGAHTCTRSAHMYQGMHTYTRCVHMCQERTNVPRNVTSQILHSQHQSSWRSKSPDWPLGPPSVLLNSYRSFFKGVKQTGREATHFQLVQKLRMSGAVTPLLLYTSMAWTGNNFSFLHHTSSCPLYSIILPYLQYNVTSELLQPMLS